MFKYGSILIAVTRIPHDFNIVPILLDITPKTKQTYIRYLYVVTGKYDLKCSLQNNVYVLVYQLEAIQKLKKKQSNIKSMLFTLAIKYC